VPLNSTRRPIRSVGRLSWAASAAETVVVVWCCPAQLQSGPVVANGGRLPYPPKRPGVRGVERPGALRCTRDGLPGALHRRREPVRVTTRSPSSQNAIGVGRVSALVVAIRGRIDRGSVKVTDPSFLKCRVRPTRWPRSCMMLARPAVISKVP